MNGNTIYETNPSNRNRVFERRPPPLKLAGNTSSRFGDYVQSTRSFWSNDAAPITRPADGFGDRSNGFRQNSASSRFPQANGAALSPLQNTRAPSKSSIGAWSSSISPVTARQQADSTSPVKQKRSNIPFSFDFESELENAPLLQDSAPDVNSMDRSTHGNAWDEEPSSYTVSDPFASSVPTNQTGARSAIYRINHDDSRQISDIVTLSQTRRNNEMRPTNRVSPSSTQYSPANTRFSSAFANGGNQNTGADDDRLARRALATLDDSVGGLSSLTLNDQISGSTLARGIARNGAYSQHAQAPDPRYGLSGGTPQPRLNAQHPEFRPIGITNSFLQLDQPAPTYQDPNMWTYSDCPPLKSGVSRSILNGQYYSPESEISTGHNPGRNLGAGGMSSRTSHLGLTMVDRRTQEMDIHYSNCAYQANGLHSISQPSYSSAFHSKGRMNPSAESYTPHNTSVYETAGINGYSPVPRMPLREQEARAPGSALLEDFHMNIKTNKRYELRDVFNHIVEFSGDQHGSRFIQQKLETANSDEKEQVFKEILEDCLQLMTDIFGNYVIQKLFEHGNQQQKKVLANKMKGQVLNLSVQPYGCRVVQKALEHVLTDQQGSIVQELNGPNKTILKVIRDQSGNHVVQKAIERAPAEHIQFIIEAHRGETVKLAQHTFGCRVIQRILEYCSPEAKRIILDELHGCITPLITDQYGNYVVQHVIEKGGPEDRRRVISIVTQNVLNFSKHKYASNVVEKCIEHAEKEQRAEICRRLVSRGENGQTPVLGLLRDQFGNYVIQRVYAYIDPMGRDALVEDMKECLPLLRKTSYGKQVIAIDKLLFGTASPATRATSQPLNPSGNNTNHYNSMAQSSSSQHQFRTPLPVALSNGFIAH